MVFLDDEHKEGKKKMAPKNKSNVKISRQIFFDAWMNPENKTVKAVALAASKEAGKSPAVSVQAMRARVKSFREAKPVPVPLPYKADEIADFSYFAKLLEKKESE